MSPMPDGHVAGSSEEGGEGHKEDSTALDAVGHATTDAETKEEKRGRDGHREKEGGASSPSLSSSAVQEAASRPGNASYRASRPRTAPIRRKPAYAFSSPGGGDKIWPVLPFAASPKQGRASTPNSASAVSPGRQWSASRAGKDTERFFMEGCGGGRGLGSDMEEGVVGMLSELASEYDTAGGGERAWRGREGIGSFVAEMGRVTGSQARVKWKGSIAQVGGVVEREGATTRCMRIEPAAMSVRPLSPGSSRDQIGAARTSELNRRLETAKAAPTHVGINRALASAMMRCTRAKAVKSAHLRRQASSAPRRTSPVMSESRSFASGVPDELVYQDTSPRRTACDVWRPRFASSSPPTPVRRNSASSTSSPTFVSLSTMDRSVPNRLTGQGGDAARAGDQQSRLRFFMEASRPQRRPTSAQGGLAGGGEWERNASRFRIGDGEASQSEGGNPPMYLSASKRPASAPAKRCGWNVATGAGDGDVGVGGGIRIMLPVVRDDERLVNAEESLDASFEGWGLGDDELHAQDVVSPLVAA